MDPVTPLPPLAPSLLRTFPVRTAPTTLAVLRRHLGRGELAGTLARLPFTGDPFRQIAAASSPAEASSRLQLDPLLRLRAALEGAGVDGARRLAVLDEVLRLAGGAFVRAAFPGPDAAGWAASDAVTRLTWLRSLTDRMFNAEIDGHEAGAHSVAFTVRGCWFVRLCHQVGHPELAPLFCAADDAAFATGPVRLERRGTLARGSTACDFRLHLDRSAEARTG